MTILATSRETQIRNLLALSGEDFLTLVENNLGEDDQPALWRLLADPLVIRRTYQTLTTIYTDVCDQLAIRGAQLDAIKAGAYDANDRQMFFDELGPYNQWRAKALGYKRLLSRRISAIKPELAKAQNPAGHGKTNPPPRMDANRKVRLMSTIFKLGQAIELHRQASYDADITAEQHDLDLWAALEEIEVQTVDGIISVAQMVEDLMSKPSFDDESTPTPTENP